MSSLRSTQLKVHPIHKLSAVNVVVGRVEAIRPHPHGEHISIADVEYGPDKHASIIFGGIREVVLVGSLVPVAPATKSCRVEGKKMRRRKFRGVYSYGELCSLYELGLTNYDTDQVAILQASLEVEPGHSLTSLIQNIQHPHEFWQVFKQPVSVKFTPNFDI